LVAALGPREIAEITVHDLRAWRADLIQRHTRYDDHPIRPAINTRGLSVYTIIGKVKCARILFDWLVEEGELVRSPAERLHAPRRPKNDLPKAISDRDIRRLASYAAREGLVREVALIHCLADTGARVRGIAFLKRSDVSLATGELIVTEKGAKSRAVYLTGAGIAALRNWLRVRPCDVNHDYVFTSLRGGARLTGSGIYQALARVARACGVERFNPHAFRHAFAREMLNAGLSLEVVADLMGHSSVSVTADSYAIWTKRELEEKHFQAARKRGLWTKPR